MNAKSVKRLFAALLVLILSLGLAVPGALAAGTVNEVAEKTGTGNIFVTVYDRAPDAAGTGAPVQIDAEPVAGVGLNALKIGSVAELTSTDEGGAVRTQVAFGLPKTSGALTLLGLSAEQAVASDEENHYFAPETVQDALENADQDAFEAYLPANGATNDVTDANGEAEFTNIPCGLYLVGKSALPASAATDLAPFVVSVPMYVQDGQSGAWQNSVYAYPKVRTAQITLTKGVDDGDGSDYAGGDIYADAAQTLAYTLEVSIPAPETGTASPFTAFSITDTNPGGTLKIDVDSVTVSLNGTAMDAPVYTQDTPQELQSGDYELHYEDAVLNLTFTADGLAKINAHQTAAQTITVAYDAAVATDGAFTSELSNSAYASYRRSGMTAPAQTAEAATRVFTYGIGVQKTLSDGAAILADTIAFMLYQTNTEGVLSDPVSFAASDAGGYWRTAGQGQTLYVDEQGQLNLYGLAPGTYYLSETATQEGYTRLAEPITIVIADGNEDGVAEASVNAAQAQVTAGVAALEVENTKNAFGFTLPQTGGAGTLLITAIGLGLLCMGVILLAVYRTKAQKKF